MKQEIIIKTNEEVITPGEFAILVASKGVPVGKTFWCQLGSIDSIKCILLSHNCSYIRGLVSAENKYLQFTVVKKQGNILDLLNSLEMTRTKNCVKDLVNNENISLSEFVTKYTWRDFLKTKNSGKKSLKDLRTALKKFGYTL
jgi:hypothetical protein